MADYSVHQVGTDTSGRDILVTAYMRDWWIGVVDVLGFTPVIVQGAFMARLGGGADASAGYHDQAGCLDLRTRDLTPLQQTRLVRVLRRHGAAAWRRDERHGMDPHLHLVLGSDYPLAPGAASQWAAYLAGRDGLASHGPDYEWRPDPIVTEPPEVDMPFTEEQLRAIVREEVARELDRPTETKKGLRSLRQQVKELFQR